MKAQLTQEFATLAEAVAALTDDRKRLVIVRENEDADGAMTLHFFDGELHALGGGVGGGSTDGIQRKVVYITDAQMKDWFEVEGTRAVTMLELLGQPTPGSKITFYFTELTFVAHGGSPAWNEIEIGLTLAETLDNIHAKNMTQTNVGNNFSAERLSDTLIKYTALFPGAESIMSNSTDDANIVLTNQDGTHGVKKLLLALPAPGEGKMYAFEPTGTRYRIDTTDGGYTIPDGGDNPGWFLGWYNEADGDPANNWQTVLPNNIPFEGEYLKGGTGDFLYNRTSISMAGRQGSDGNKPLYLVWGGELNPTGGSDNPDKIVVCLEISYRVVGTNLENFGSSTVGSGGGSYLDTEGGLLLPKPGGGYLQIKATGDDEEPLEFTNV